MSPRTYTVQISDVFAETFKGWRSIEDLGAKWMRVVAHDDGTAEIWFNSDEDKPSDGARDDTQTAPEIDWDR